MSGAPRASSGPRQLPGLPALLRRRCCSHPEEEEEREEEREEEEISAGASDAEGQRVSVKPNPE